MGLTKGLVDGFLMKDGTPISTDDLAFRTGMPTSKISALTLAMEIKGAVRRTPGNLLEQV